jgi:hypothetical protein
MPTREELRSMAEALLDVADEIVAAFPFQANQLRNVSRALIGSDQEPKDQES